MKDHSIPGQGSLRGVITSNLQGLNGAIRSIDNVEQVPRLQIALPLGFDEWDGQTPIKVAYTPLTIDDVDAEEIYAYDAAGNEHVLDASTPPDFPVMVVGINERTDDEGNVMVNPLPSPGNRVGGMGSSGGASGGPRSGGEQKATVGALLCSDCEDGYGAVSVLMLS